MSTEFKQDAREKAERLATSLEFRSGGGEAGSKPAKPKGVLNAKVIRSGFFILFSLGLFATAAVCILAVWDWVSSLTAFRVTVTFVIAVVTLSLFAVINEALADKVSLWSFDRAGAAEANNGHSSDDIRPH